MQFWPEAHGVEDAEDAGVSAFVAEAGEPTTCRETSCALEGAGAPSLLGGISSVGFAWDTRALRPDRRPHRIARGSLWGALAGVVDSSEIDCLGRE